MTIYSYAKSRGLNIGLVEAYISQNMKYFEPHMKSVAGEYVLGDYVIGRLDKYFSAKHIVQNLSESVRRDVEETVKHKTHRMTEEPDDYWSAAEDALRTVQREEKSLSDEVISVVPCDDRDIDD